MTHHDVAVAETIDVGPDSPMTADRVLRHLELMRRRLAIRWWGSEGAFAGYDELQLSCPVPVTSGAVTFSARLLNPGDTTHSVELVAMAPAIPSTTGSSRVIARGKGQTLQIQTAPRKSMEIS